MKQVAYLFFAILFSSCAASEVRLDGAFKNNKDQTRTIVRKINEKEYHIYSEVNPALEFTAIRNGNALSGIYQGLPITLEYSRSYDTFLTSLTE
jgi:hypothetical protein